MNPIDKSLKRKEVFYSEEPEAKNVKINLPIEHETKWVDFEELQSDLISQLKSTDAFPERLKQICTYTDDPGEVKRIYITLDTASELCICLSIRTKPAFGSEALSETLFAEDNVLGRSFIEIKVHESYSENDEFQDKQILNIRCSENGLLNELVKIEKGHNISGTKGMEIFEMIVPWFGLRKVYLYDDAQLPYLNNNAKKQFLPIRKCSIFIEDGQSWYEKKGFELVECVSMPILDNIIKISQNPYDYRNAKEFVCMTQLKDLCLYTGAFPVVCNKIMTMQKKYLPSVQAEPTIKDLVSAIVKISQSPIGKVSLPAKNDLLFFFDKCMKPWNTPEKNPSLQNYLKAIQIIEDARIYVKEYAMNS